MDKVNMTKGLTNTEVEEQKKLGNVNVTTIKVGNSNKDIIIKNSMTIFNLLNLILAVVLFVIGSYKNMLFIFSIISNTSIGIYQEIKAKRIIEKLSFLKQEKVEVIREGEKASIHKEELVLNDIICLKKGDQIPVDAISLENGMDVDESMITGESDFIEKQTGDFIYSGSLVMQGTAKAQVQAVGNHTFISKLVKEASVLKKAKSKIQQQIDKILKIIVIGIIPICIFIFRFVCDSTKKDSNHGIIIGVAIFAMLALAYKFPIYTSFTNGHVVTHYKEFISDVTLIIGSVQLFSLYLLCRPLSRFRAIVITGMTALFYGTYFIEPVTKFLGIAPFTSFRFLIPTSICILLILIIRADVILKS